MASAMATARVGGVGDGSQMAMAAASTRISAAVRKKRGRNLKSLKISRRPCFLAKFGGKKSLKISGRRENREDRNESTSRRIVN